MKIRRARIDDAKAISKICCDTIRYVNSKDYSASQIKAWLTSDRVSNVRNKIKHKKKDVFVIVDKDIILGMGSLSLEEDELSSLYIKHNVSRKGIGTKLLKYLEKYAKRKGVSTLKLNSSVTAYSFYKHRGYKGIRKRYRIIKNVRIPYIFMSKRL